MSHAHATKTVETVRIRRAMNDHQTMTVENVETNATRHLVEYSSPELEQTLTALPVGATIPLELEPVGARSNVWRAVGMYAESPKRNDGNDGPLQFVD